MPVKKKVIYLTFDDGPHPTITPWVLNELKKYEAKATFFCIGANVEKFPETYKLVLDEGHSTGNHTQHHLNGWKTEPTIYLNDVAAAAKSIKTNLFRPPYGKVKPSQAAHLKNVMQGEKIEVIMWDVLSADFDRNVAPEECAKNVIRNAEPGSIAVFHDSEKAFRNLKVALPLVLSYLKQEGYVFGKIEMEQI